MKTFKTLSTPRLVSGKKAEPALGGRFSRDCTCRFSRSSASENQASRDSYRTDTAAESQLSNLPVKLVNRDPSVALAYTYLGDAVWELYARRHMILQRVTEASQPYSPIFVIRPQEATKQGWSSSVAMCAHLRRLIDSMIITKEELMILNWGRDYGHESRPRHNEVQHKEASSFEALIAYWYLFDQKRLHSILSHLGMSLHERHLQNVSYDQVESKVFAVSGSTHGGSSNVGEDFQKTAINSVSTCQRERLGYLLGRMSLLETRISELEQENLNSKRPSNPTF